MFDVGLEVIPAVEEFGFWNVSEWRVGLVFDAEGGGGAHPHGATIVARIYREAAFDLIAREPEPSFLGGISIAIVGSGGI